MKKEKLEKLKEVLSIPTYYDQEGLMVDYLKNHLSSGNYNYRLDELNNIYVTKGDGDSYPCFVSHIDTVHQVDENLKVIQAGDRLFGMSGMRYSGIGGDDKCGVFLCLEMLEQLDNVKVAFFVGEEYGMKGSKQACKEFFKDVRYSIQFDSPEHDTMSMTLMDKPLFDKESQFGNIVSPILKQRGVTKWQDHPYTDTYQLMIKFDFPCLNIAAGYFRYHTVNEYVSIKSVENSRQLALELADELGELEFEKVLRSKDINLNK